MLKVATTGASGMLGRALYHTLNTRGCEYFPIDINRAGCDFLPMEISGADIRNREEITAVVSGFRPQAVVNCAALTDVDGCETQQELAYAVNGDGAGNVAAAARAAGALMIQISTDYVFDGRKGTPYTEEDGTHPLGVYAKSKLKGEIAVSEEAEEYFIIRTSWLYGSGGKNFVDTIRRLAKERESLSVVNDQTGSPTYTVHLAAAISRIIRMYVEGKVGRPGVYHVTGDGHCTWHELAKKIVEYEPGKTKEIHPVSTEEFGSLAPRPRFSVLSNEKVKKRFGVALPHWEDALFAYISSTLPGG